MPKNTYDKIRCVRYTSKHINKSKMVQLQLAFDESLRLQNQYSKYVYDHISELFDRRHAQHFCTNHYKACRSLYPANILTYWTTQNLFLTIISDYIKTMQLQYNRLFDRKLNKYKVVKVVKYLILCNENNLIKSNTKIANDVQYCFAKYGKDRILKLVHSIKNRLIKNINLHNYKSRVYRVNKDHCGKIFINPNSNYRYWLQIRLKSGLINIPLQINEKYHDTKQFSNTLLIMPARKGITCISYEPAKPLVMQPFKNVVAIDINLKHNFLYLSDGKSFDYNHDLLQELYYANDKHLAKAVTRVMENFKRVIHECVQYCVSKNITDVVIEELHAFVGLNLSYILKLIHFSDVKKWIVRQFEKVHIRVHQVHPQYTSIMCHNCGYIDKLNRQSQETFKCRKCGHVNNADANASLNILLRYNNIQYRNKLHDIDSFGRLYPKNLPNDKVRQILLECF